MTSQKNKGLTTQEAFARQKKYGKNELATTKKENFIVKIFHIVKEPMFLLLLIASIVYFVLGEARDGSIMLVFVIAIISIEVIQEWKTDKTLAALKDLSAPKITVIRDNEEKEINSTDLVPGDVMLIHEGIKIPADGIILESNDLCVDESTLTGESTGVWKNSKEEEGSYWRKDYCYAGTLVIQGGGIIKVDKIGISTEYGKISQNISEVKHQNTPLEKQTSKLVKTCAILAALLFIVVGVITYFNLPDHEFTERIIESILAGITLAMAMIPEEFPVVLTVFLSMGAWRLAKKKALVRKMSSVETLGAVSVLCLDKTGTITLNQMQVHTLSNYQCSEDKLTYIMGLGCETNPYDPMEKAMLQYLEEKGINKEELFSGTLISEYPFTNETKMMGHVWNINGKIIIAAKGSPESILNLCKIDNKEEQLNKVRMMSEDGLRVIAIAVAEDYIDVPQQLNDCQLTFLGLIGLYDPPKDIKKEIQICNKAIIKVVMITGDNGITAASIAKQIGMLNPDKSITGAMIDEMNDEQLKEAVKGINIFSRVIPEHKMRIVKAFKENGEIVAMTGDGVNDAPALKYADIGIAMGKKGNEVSREAADLILMDDNFSTIIETIKDGRRIYDNILRAVCYIFSIHIPIALASLMAPLLGINPGSLMLLPLHVVLLELIIDPTCSIVLERLPAEKDILLRKPRRQDEKLINLSSLLKSILHGLIIFIGAFGLYYYTLTQKDDAQLARTMGIMTIIFANIFLVIGNSSKSEFIFQSFLRLIKDKVMWIIALIIIILAGVIMYTPLNEFLKLTPLSFKELAIVFGVAALSVIWYEVVKLFKKIRKK